MCQKLKQAKRRAREEFEEVLERTQKIRRVRGKVWWAKMRRKIVRRDNGKVVEFEEVKYGMLMMVLCECL